MRVVFNLLQTLKPKAGVGHYAARTKSLTPVLTEAAVIALPIGARPPDRMF